MHYSLCLRKNWKNILSMLFLIFLLINGAVRVHPAAASSPTLSGYWPFNEGSGTTTADSSGNNNTGAITGATWTTGGKIRDALSFTGTTNYVSMGYPTALKFGTGSFTVMSWFNTSSTAFQRIVDMGMDTWDTGFELSFDETGICPNGNTSGCVTAAIGGGTGSSAASVAFGSTLNGLNDGNWHQAALVVDQTGHTAQLYIDGTLQPVTVASGYCTSGTAVTSVNISGCANLNATSASSAEPFTVGALRSTAHPVGNPFTGSIDEVRAYNSALSSSQIQNQYAADTTSPSGYWPLDEGTNTTTADSSGNNNTGAITGATWGTGEVNDALTFTGTNYVSMVTPTNILKFGTGSFTAISWFRTTLTTNERMISTGVSGWSNGFDLSASTFTAANGGCTAGCVGGEVGAGNKAGTLSFVSTATFNDGNWHQAAMVIDQTANTGQIYVDGVVQALSKQTGTCGTITGSTISITTTTPDLCTFSATAATDPFTLGAYRSAGGSTSFGFTGSLDEVRAYNSALSGAQILNQYNSDTTAAAPTAAGYWKFNEGSGTTINDSSGAHNPGTTTAGPDWTTVSKALTFNGTSSSVSMGTPAALSFGTGSLTVMNWFKAQATTTIGHRMVSNGEYGWIPGYFIGVNSTSTCTTGCIGGGVGGTGGQGSSLSFNTTATFDDNAWHQEAMVIDRVAKTAQIYIDGVAQPVSSEAGTCGTASGNIVSIASVNCALSATPTAEAFTVGSHIGTGEYFNGSIKEVRVYGMALSNSQIHNQYTIDTTPSPAGYWHFDENSGITASNSSSNNNPGALTPGPLAGGPTWTNGELNSALSFNGSSNYVTMGTLSTLEFNNTSFTISSWFNLPPGAAVASRLAGEGVTNYGSGFTLGFDGTCAGCLRGNIGANGTSGNTVKFITTSSFNDSTWHQAVMVVDEIAKTAQIYVDGVAQPLTKAFCGTVTGTNTMSFPAVSCGSVNAYNTTEPFTVGNYKGTNGTGEFFGGSIDEVRVYGSALTSQQILNQYNSDTTLSPAGYWKFDEGSGTTASDSSPNNSPGTLSGTVLPAWTSGEINTGLSFNGSNNYVTMGTPSALQFGTGSFTVMSWFKTTTTTFSRLVDMGLNSWANGYDLSINIPTDCTNGCIGAEIGAGGTQTHGLSFYTTNTFKDGNWHQAAMVIDQTAKTGQIYVDGVAQTLTTTSGTCGSSSGTTVSFGTCTSLNATSTDPFIVGADYHASAAHFFSGSLDEVGVYGNALTGEQVLNRYNSDNSVLSENAANESFTGTPGSTAIYTLPMTVSYLLTPAPGWSLAITSTTLTSGTNTLPLTASSINSVANACPGTCTPTTMTNTVSTPIAIPAAATAPTGVKFFGTAAGTGTGAYTITPTIWVTIPIITKIGTYTSVVTLTASNGP